MRAGFLAVAVMCVLAMVSSVTAVIGSDDSGGFGSDSARSQVVGFGFRVSGPDSTNDDRFPAVAYNPTANQYLVVWRAGHGDGIWGNDIYARRVRADGSRVGGDFLISDGSAASDVGLPAVAYNSTANQYLVVWSDWRGSVPGFDIYGQRVAASGRLVGPASHISAADAASDRDLPVVAYNPVTNQYLVVWADARNRYQPPLRGYDIYGRLVSARGSPVGRDFRISGPGATAWDSHPAVVYNPTANEFLVVWVDPRDHEARGADIYGRRIAADGSRVGFDFRISDPGATAWENQPAVAHNPITNQYLVVWQDDRDLPTSQHDVYGRRVRANGSRVGDEFRISRWGPTSGGGAPEVTYVPTSNQYLVVWSDYRSVNRGADIYGRRLTARGNRTGLDFRISGPGATANERDPAVVYNSVADESLVVWEDYRSDAARGQDIYGRRVSG